MPKKLGVEGSITRDILEFCLRHADRQDTIEGIAEWWLMEHQISWTVKEVRSALEELVGRHLMVEGPSVDGRVHYRVNPDRLGEIEQLLDEDSTPTAESQPS